MYRGQLRALLSDAEALIFTTEHTERHPMAVYWVSPQGGALKSQELPGGGLALARDDKRLYVACTDGRVYAGSIEARGIGELSALAGYAASDDAISGLAILKGGLLAVASGAQIALVDRAGARGVVQTLDTPDPVTALTSDVSGEWLVAGTRIGEVHVFDGERQAQFAFSAKAVGEEGQVDVFVSAFFRRRLDRVHLVVEGVLGVVEETTDEGRFAVVDTAGGRKTQQVHVEITFVDGNFVLHRERAPRARKK